VLGSELSLLAKALSKNGVEVCWLEADWFPSPRPNLMFVRDQFMMTPWGALLGRMASPVRAGEEKWAQLALARAGVPVLWTVRGRGTFEGADGLWLSPSTVAVGVGNRTNAAGFEQVRHVLREFGVTVVPVPLPRSVQHLLGLLQIVSPEKVLLRTEHASSGLRRLLSRHELEIIPVPESEEVVSRQGMNVLTVAPNRVIMASGCPRLHALYERNGIKILAEAEISQLVNAAGGIACASAPLFRSSR
jgi:N-dimethylarginine dimethylaminohydrolase